MVKVKSRGELIKLAKNKYPDKDPQSFGNFADLISNQFKNFPISHAKAFNKRYNRRGSLFLDNLNRNKIEDDTYFTQLVRYIHLNPVKHRFTDKPANWSHSSYNSFLSERPTQLQRKEVLQWFSGRENFIKAHKNPEGF